MKNKNLSFIVRCWRNEPTEPLYFRVIEVEAGQEVALNNNSFLVRVSLDQKGVARCLIRHINTNNEAFLQSGAAFQDFIKACLPTEAQQESAENE